MKNFQQNLLLVLALALCGLCAWQWYAQTVQRNHIDSLDQLIFKQSTDIQGYTNSIKTMDAEIAALQARLNDLKQEAMTNAQLILSQKRDLLRLHVSSDSMSNEIVQYQAVTNGRRASSAAKAAKVARLSLMTCQAGIGASKPSAIWISRQKISANSSRDCSSIVSAPLIVTEIRWE